MRDPKSQQEALETADKLPTASCDDYYNKYKFSRY